MSTAVPAAAVKPPPFVFSFLVHRPQDARSVTSTLPPPVQMPFPRVVRDEREFLPGKELVGVPCHCCETSIRSPAQTPPVLSSNPVYVFSHVIGAVGGPSHRQDPISHVITGDGRGRETAADPSRIPHLFHGARRRFHVKRADQHASSRDRFFSHHFVQRPEGSDKDGRFGRRKQEGIGASNGILCDFPFWVHGDGYTRALPYPVSDRFFSADLCPDDYRRLKLQEPL